MVFEGCFEGGVLRGFFFGVFLSVLRVFFEGVLKVVFWWFIWCFLRGGFEGFLRGFRVFFWVF